MKHQQTGMTKAALLAIAQANLTQAQAEVRFVNSLPDDPIGLVVAGQKKPPQGVKKVFWMHDPANAARAKKTKAKLSKIRKEQVRKNHGKGKGHSKKKKPAKMKGVMIGGVLYANPDGKWARLARERLKQNSSSSRTAPAAAAPEGS